MLQVSQLYYAVGERVLLDHQDLQIQAGERVCLVGRNGSGKSSLLSMIQGSRRPDSGDLLMPSEWRVASMEQNLKSLDPECTVRECVAEGLASLGRDLQRWQALSESGEQLEEMATLQARIEMADGWRIQQRIDTTLSQLELKGEQRLGDLSGGWQRRVLLARAWVQQPDLLLLDEPTNHLDLASIEWLEKQLLEFNGALLFISHDRRFIDRLATRIVELDRGILRSYPGRFSEYRQRREEELEVEARHNAEFDRQLAKEEVWIRQGIKARRTRNEGRVRALEKMRKERAQRLERSGNANFKLSGDSSSKRIVELENVSLNLGGKPLVKDLDLLITRGDKLALIGPNGVGKTSLLRLMLEDLEPDAGRIVRGTRQQVAWFKQLPDPEDESRSVADVVGEGRENIEVGGRSRHIISYLGDFLFEPQRTREPLRVLSGGERARVQLARLFSQPANILVMDEPTNDLDMETLELLESLLVEFDGTVLLVSHDRSFVDNVASGCLRFEGNARWSEYVGGYSDMPPLQAREAVEKSVGNTAPKAAASKPAQSKPSRRKLSYKLQRELELLPEKIEQLEKQLEEAAEQANAPGFYDQPGDVINEQMQQMAAWQAELDEAMERWLELEAETEA